MTLLRDMQPAEAREWVEYVAIGDSEQNSVSSLTTEMTRYKKGEQRKNPIQRRAVRMSKDKKYRDRMIAGTRFLANAFAGEEKMERVAAALSVGDLSNLFTDTLSHLVFMGWERYPKTYQAFLKTSTVPDFRDVRRTHVYGETGGLDFVPAGGSYKEGSLADQSYTFAVKKYGRRYNLQMEMFVNDERDKLTALPDTMVEDAVDEECEQATTAYAGNTTLYSASHTMGGSGTFSNINASAALSAANLKAAIAVIAAYTNSAGRPLKNRIKYLVIPPVLEVTALEILNGNYVPATLAAKDIIPEYGLQLVIDPYIPIVDPTNGATSWYLFSDLGMRSFAGEVAFLQGFDAPQVLRRSGNTVASGNDIMPEAGFDDDVVSFKVRHIVGAQHANAIDNWVYTYWAHN